MAALADSIAVVVHGLIGHRIIMKPLTPDRLFSTQAFGDADISRRALLVTWHVPTAAFACSAVAMFLSAFGYIGSMALPLFLSVMHASFILVGLWIFRVRAARLWRPIPLTFLACMSTVALTAWLGAR